MDPKIIDGKLIAEQIKKEIAAEVAAMLDKGIPAPHLAAVLVATMAQARPTWPLKRKLVILWESSRRCTDSQKRQPRRNCSTLLTS